MPKQKTDEAFQKHTLNLYEGDFEKLQMLYPELGGAVIVRQLVRAHILKIETNAAQNMPASPTELVP